MRTLKRFIRTWLQEVEVYKRLGEETLEILRGVKERYDRADFIDYLAHQRERGLCQNTVLSQMVPIKLLAQIQGWEKDYPKLSMDKVKSEDINRPILTKWQVVQLITEGQQKLSGRDLAYVALATTYGLRREELAKLNVGEVLAGVDIRMNALKGGSSVVQLVPEEIKPHIGGYKKATVQYMSLMFKRIVKKCGLVLEGGHGWHSIRRALATELLLEDVSALNIIRFMRWSEASIGMEFGMLSIYAQRNQAKVDRAVFKGHPFLRYWK